MKRISSLFLLFFLFGQSIALGAQTTAGLEAGPMLGYGDMREALVWLQTKGGADARIRYWKKSQPDLSFTSETVRTSAPNFFTAKIVLTDVLPGESYGYEVQLNGKALAFPYPTEFKMQALWQYRTEPPAFSVAFGSCHYVNEFAFDRPGKPYGGDYGIFTAIHQKRPDVMLWLGDNTYLREADWGSRSGVFKRYAHSRALPEMQPLLASTFHYAIWDDHDYGPNDSDASYVGADWTLEAFEAFWGNPSFGLPGQRGITTAFEFNDVDFFMLDNRTFRSPNHCKTCKRTMLGEAQFEWIVGALKASRAPFKIVCIGGQVLSTAAVHENYSNYFPEEREKLLQRLSDENIKGVIFLTGDRHHSELSRYKNAAGNWVHDFTCSPLTSGVSNVKPAEEANLQRVEGSLFTQRLFGMLSFSGPREDRTLRVDYHDTGGNSVWHFEIKAKEL